MTTMVMELLGIHDSTQGYLEEMRAQLPYIKRYFALIKFTSYFCLRFCPNIWPHTICRGRGEVGV